MDRIIKTNDSHKTVTFAVLVPDEPDLNNDVISADEIVKTAHNFVESLDLKKINIDHSDDTDMDNSLVKIVESYILPTAIDTDEWELPEWTWMVALKFEDDDLYQSLLSWEYVWVSMEWKWYKE